jgi:hypothetical protein
MARDMQEPRPIRPTRSELAHILVSTWLDLLVVAAWTTVTIIGSLGWPANVALAAAVVALIVHFASAVQEIRADRRAAPICGPGQPLS